MTSGLLNAVVAEDLPGPGSVFLHVDWSFRAPVRPGDEITAEVEVLEVRDDKPIATLRTTITNQDGTVVLDGTALVWTEPIVSRQRAGESGSGTRSPAGSCRRAAGTTRDPGGSRPRPRPRDRDASARPAGATMRERASPLKNLPPSNSSSGARPALSASARSAPGASKSGGGAASGGRGGSTAAQSPSSPRGRTVCAPRPGSRPAGARKHDVPHERRRQPPEPVKAGPRSTVVPTSHAPPRLPPQARPPLTATRPRSATRRRNAPTPQPMSSTRCPARARRGGAPPRSSGAADPR